MQVDDIDLVDAIAQTSFPTPWSSQTYRREIENGPNSSYWVVRPGTAKKDAGPWPRVLAYGGMWLLGAEAHLLILATHPAWRRCGLAEWLLLNMLTFAAHQGAKSTTLEVRESNRAAQSLYKNLGFEEEGRRKNYYRSNPPHGSHEDAVLLTLNPIRAELFEQKLKLKNRTVLYRIGERSAALLEPDCASHR